MNVFLFTFRLICWHSYLVNLLTFCHIKETKFNVFYLDFEFVKFNYEELFWRKAYSQYDSDTSTMEMLCLS